MVFCLRLVFLRAVLRLKYVVHFVDGFMPGPSFIIFKIRFFLVIQDYIIPFADYLGVLFLPFSLLLFV